MDTQRPKTRVETDFIERELSRLAGAGIISSWRRTRTWGATSRRSWFITWPDGHRAAMEVQAVAAFIRGAATREDAV